MLSVGLLVGACTSWHPQALPLPEVLAREKLSRIRVTQSDGRQVVVYAPRLVGDTVEGLASPPRRFGRVPDSLRMGLPAVAAVATRRVSWGRSLALVGGGLVAGTGIVLLIECQNRNCVP